MSPATQLHAPWTPTRADQPGTPSAVRHIDAGRLQCAVIQHTWMGCDVVLTQEGFHRIHEWLDTWHPPTRPPSVASARC